MRAQQKSGWNNAAWLSELSIESERKRERIPRAVALGENERARKGARDR